MVLLDDGEVEGGVVVGDVRTLLGTGVNNSDAVSFPLLWRLGSGVDVSESDAVSFCLPAASVDLELFAADSR